MGSWLNYADPGYQGCLNWAVVTSVYFEFSVVNILNITISKLWTGFEEGIHQSGPCGVCQGELCENWLSIGYGWHRGLPPGWHPPQRGVWDPAAPLKATTYTPTPTLTTQSGFQCRRGFHNMPVMAAVFTGDSRSPNLLALTLVWIATQTSTADCVPLRLRSPQRLSRVDGFCIGYCVEYFISRLRLTLNPNLT